MRKQQRPEEPALLKLRDAVRLFNDGVPSRNSYTDKDRALLASLSELAATYIRTAAEAWRDTVSPIDGRRSEAPRLVNELATHVTDYVQAATGEDSISVGSVSTSVPRIESLQFRAALHQAGVVLLRRIDDAAAAGVQRENDHERELREIESAVSYWLARNKTHAKFPALLMGYWAAWAPIARRILAVDGIVSAAVPPEPVKAPANSDVRAAALTPSPGPVSATFGRDFEEQVANVPRNTGPSVSEQLDRITRFV